MKHLLVMKIYDISKTNIMNEFHHKREIYKTYKNEKTNI